MTYKVFSSDYTSTPTQISIPKVDVHTLEENIVSKIRSDVDNAMRTVGTRVQVVLLTAIEKLVIVGVEIAM